MKRNIFTSNVFLYEYGYKVHINQAVFVNLHKKVINHFNKLFNTFVANELLMHTTKMNLNVEGTHA